MSLTGQSLELCVSQTFSAVEHLFFIEKRHPGTSCQLFLCSVPHNLSAPVPLERNTGPISGRVLFCCVNYDQVTQNSLDLWELTALLQV